LSIHKKKVETAGTSIYLQHLTFKKQLTLLASIIPLRNMELWFVQPFAKSVKEMKDDDKKIIHVSRTVLTRYQSCHYIVLNGEISDREDKRDLVVLEKQVFLVLSEMEKTVDSGVLSNCFLLLMKIISVKQEGSACDRGRLSEATDKAPATEGDCRKPVMASHRAG
ncbi:17293_t:CDS:2, partial [Funneliformis geosporum]